MLKEIFSVPIYVLENKCFLSETVEAFDTINIEKYYAPNLYGVSGFTTYFNSEASKKIEHLIPNVMDFILKESKNYLNLMGYDITNHKLSMANVWFTRMKENSNHNFHTHAEINDKKTIVGGTYYLKTPLDSSSITFSRSEGEFFNRPNIPNLEENSFTRRFYSYNPSEGSLVLFLAETFHGVLANKSLEGRDTLSFNIMVEKNGNT